MMYQVAKKLIKIRSNIESKLSKNDPEEPSEHSRRTMGQKNKPQMIEDKIDDFEGRGQSYYYLKEDIHNLRNSSSPEEPVEKAFEHVNNLEMGGLFAGRHAQPQFSQ